MANGNQQAIPRSIAQKIMTGVSSALIIICVVGGVGHEVRIAVIEGNRFTSQDWNDTWREIGQEFRQLRDELAAIRTNLASLPKESPQKWFKSEVDHLKICVEKVLTGQTELATIVRLHLKDHK